MLSTILVRIFFVDTVLLNYKWIFFFIQNDSCKYLVEENRIQLDAI